MYEKRKILPHKDTTQYYEYSNEAEAHAHKLQASVRNFPLRYTASISISLVVFFS